MRSFTQIAVRPLRVKGVEKQYAEGLYHQVKILLENLRVGF